MADTNKMNYLDPDGLIFLWMQLKTMLSGKVDKETGKSLLSDSEIVRLASLVNYDDADVRSMITTMQGQISSLESGTYDDTALRQFIASTYATLANTYTKTEVDNKIPDISVKADKSNTYTKTEVDAAILAKIASVYTPKGNVSTYANLPTSGMEVGWVYNVLDTGDNYVWMGVSDELPDGWDKLAGTVDLSGYVQFTDLVALTNDEISNILAM